MKLLMIVLVLSVASTKLKAQPDTLSLPEAYRLARENAPLAQQFELNATASELKKQSISTTNLPSPTAYGKAWYQSDAVTTPSFAPGMEGLSIDRFQYNFGVELNQKIFDGGVVQRQLAVEEAALQTKNAQLETELYHLNDQINQYFFNILLLDKSYEVLDLKKETLLEQTQLLRSGVEHGVVLSSELEKLQAELISLEQQQVEVKYTIESLKNNLKILTGIERDRPIVLKEPEEIIPPVEGKRPEYLFLDRQLSSLDRSKALKGRQLMPKVYAYAQLGYSYPGLNFFENEADPYYMVGGRLSWSFFDWNKTKKEKQVLEVEQQGIGIQRKELNKNLLMQQEKMLLEIQKFEELIGGDLQVIEKRERIVDASSSALEHGTITFATYLDDLNAEIKARLDLKKHEIQLLQAKAELAVIRGIAID